MSVMRINSNLAAVTALRYLDITSVNLTKTLSRLSSGLRIVSAADDPAGLIISEQLRGQIASLRASARNVSEADKFFSIAEAALNEVNTLLVDMRGLVTHASNGATSQDQRDADYLAFANAVDSIISITATTRYGGDKIFDGVAKNYLIGEDPNDVITYTMYQFTQNDNEPFPGEPVVGSDLETLNNILDWLPDPLIPLTGAEKAALTFASLDNLTATVSSERGDIGAYQRNVFQSRERTLAIQIENIIAAESNIRDANMALEATDFTRYSILSQAGIAVLAQANVITQNVLQLLG